jgi:hypothetical protein
MRAGSIVIAEAAHSATGTDIHPGAEIGEDDVVTTRARPCSGG